MISYHIILLYIIYYILYHYIYIYILYILCTLLVYNYIHTSSHWLEDHPAQWLVGKPCQVTVLENLLSFEGPKKEPN